MVRFNRPRVRKRKAGISGANPLHHTHKSNTKRLIGGGNELIVTTQPASKPSVSLFQRTSKKNLKEGTPGISLKITSKPGRKHNISFSYRPVSLAKMIQRERKAEAKRLAKSQRPVDKVKKKALLAATKPISPTGFRKGLAEMDPFKQVPVRQFKDVFPDMPGQLSPAEKEELFGEEEKKFSVGSSRVRSFAYHEQIQILTVQWTGGGMGYYDGVPLDIFHKVLFGDSKIGCKTSGSNQWGTWYVGKKPSIGRAVEDWLVGHYEYFKIH